jgi:hypothetical protein
MAVIIALLLSFLSHGLLVPEANAVAVGIDELDPIAPE